MGVAHVAKKSNSLVNDGEFKRISSYNDNNHEDNQKKFNKKTTKCICK